MFIVHREGVGGTVKVHREGSTNIDVIRGHSQGLRQAVRWLLVTQVTQEDTGHWRSGCLGQVETLLWQDQEWMKGWKELLHS